MNIPPDRMVELLGPAYGLTSAPREWFVDLTGTINALGGRRCHVDPCLWRVFNDEGTIVGIVGIFVDDLLFAGNEESETWVRFLQELHDHYEWSPWETDSFTHCGIKDSIYIDHASFGGDLSQMQGRQRGDGPSQGHCGIGAMASHAIGAASCGQAESAPVFPEHKRASTDRAGEQVGSRDSRKPIHQHEGSAAEPNQT